VELLDSTALRRFVGIDLDCERVPGGTTLLKFRRLLEQHQVGQSIFAKVRCRHLAKRAPRSFVALGMGNTYPARKRLAA